MITSVKFSSATVIIAARNVKERESIGSLLIALDLVFFIGSILDTILAVYILWDTIKKIGKEKVYLGASKVVPADIASKAEGKEMLKEVRIKYGAASKEYKEALNDMRSK